MKKTTFILGVILCLLCLNLQAQVPYNIKGSWAQGKGKKVKLASFDGSKMIATDSVMIGSDGTFSFNRSIPTMMPVTVEIEGLYGEEVYVDGEPITVSVVRKPNDVGDTIEQIVVSGSKEQSILRAGNDLRFAHFVFGAARRQGLKKAREEADATLRQQKIDSVKRVSDWRDQELEKAVDSLIYNNLDSYAITVFLSNYVARNRGLDSLETDYKALSPRVKASSAGKELRAYIDNLHKVAVGGFAPDFTLSSPDGKKISLSQLRGKYVLLDFWASWCGPCRAEMPNLKAIYAKHHKDGLEILSVSLDEKRDKWIGAIKQIGMPWLHVSDLKGWNSEAAKLFDVTAIPRMYIMDPKGKIIYKDLRGTKLAQAMDRIFQ